jgi:hypothetical protein
MINWAHSFTFWTIKPKTDIENNLINYYKGLHDFFNRSNE